MKKFLLFILLLLISNHSFAIAPIVLNSLAGNNTTICIGEQTFYIDGTPGGIWSSSDTLIAKVDTSGIAIGISAGIVTITYSIGTSYVTKTVTVYPHPSPIYGPVNICISGWVTLYDTAEGGGSWGVYSAGGISLYYANAYSATVYPGSVGDWGSVVFVDTAGCSTGASVITVGYLPPISGVTTIYVDSSTTLHDFELGIGPDNWSSSDTAIATIGSTTGLVTGISPGTVTISCIFGCEATAILTVLPTSGLPILFAGNGKIDIFPNPATTSLTISASDYITNIAITNFLGKTVYSNEYSAPQVQIDVEDLPTGMYFVKVNGSEVRKFIKQ